LSRTNPNFASLCVFVSALGLTPRPANASPPGVAIGQQTDIATYQHYLEDLLYTHLGQSRAFGPQHDLARDNIVATLQAFGLPVALEPFVYNSVTYYNVVATQEGTDNPTQTIVLGAHFDSVPAGPGADDNGTGTAMVMELARVLSRHRSSRRIRYVLFDREEQGRRGSIAYVAAHGADNTVMAVTADMVGHDSGAYGMDLYGRTTSSAVVNGVGTAIQTYGNGLARFVNLGNYSFSDHWSFETAGIPAVVIIERCYTCNANYHTANDAVDFSPTYISYPMLADLLRSVAGYMVDATPVALWCDYDNDGDVDGIDLANYRACHGGPATGACIAFDKNRDNVVDCLDWPAFKAAHLASTGFQPVLPLDDFVAVLVGANTAPADLCIADANVDGLADGRDVAAYLAALLP
jgi:hypothetical protein